MRFTLLIAAPLVLLAACGDRETADGASPPTGGAETGAASSMASGQGPAAFAQCRTCHSVEPGKNGLGPSLFGVVGSKAGHVEGFQYSPALANSGITWDRASLDTWMQGPMKMVPGARMTTFQPDAGKRKEIIDYLETLK